MVQIKNLGGWQCWVDLYDSYVIKTFKTRKEIRNEIENYLRWTGRLEELEERTDKMIYDIKNSSRIIKNSKIPKKLIANVEFLNDGKVKQKRVLVLHEKMSELNNKDKKKIIDKIPKFLLELWKHGIHEKTFKVFSNIGIDKNDLVLIDIFELSSNKKKVLKQIKKRQWTKQEKYEKYISLELIRYFIEKMDEILTKENLEKNWRTKLKK